MIVYRKPPFIVDDGTDPPSNRPSAPASPPVLLPEVEDDGDVCTPKNETSTEDDRPLD
jgi:hypothetical protein